MKWIDPEPNDFNKFYQTYYNSYYDALSKFTESVKEMQSKLTPEVLEKLISSNS